MRECVNRWKTEIESCGMLKGREDDRDWLSVEGGGAILQLRVKDTYIRVVCNEQRPLEFEFSRYVSVDYLSHPKTDFHLAPYEPKILDKDGVERELFGA